MLQGLFQAIGGLTRDVKEATEATAEFVIDEAGDLANEIASIPKYLEEGYDKGLMSTPDQEGEGFVDPETPKQDKVT